MKKRTLILGLAAVATLGLITGCGTKEKAAKTDAKETAKNELTLSFGAMPAVDSLPVYIAEKEGFFEDEGLKLDLQSFKSPKDRDAALSSGNLDGANTDLVAVSAYLQGDMKFQVVSQSIGTFSILTSNEEVKTLADLKDKKVGIAKNQAPYYFLDEALKTADLSVADIAYEEVPQIPVRVELTGNQKIDATVVPEPFRTIGLANGLTELGNSNELGIDATVFGFTTESLTDNKEAVEAFYRGYNKGVDYINDHKLDDYYDVMKEKIGFTDEIKGRVSLPKYTHAEQIKSEQLSSVLTWSKEQGIYSKELKQEDILNPLLSK
ncbi:ABC transporter substrate-binding protein [Vagococcus fluvialis]|uniref:ABC transporter substrate-binding protein n=1 Tax=Vagococcus fluvialis TaxID=2738 RepID=UPI001D0A165A|nr:ABC transporter substrate-binding protein [Vagococcus fluvialis]MDT2781938.1 ABC transporter substrate-binding protein [Vagococcus fluvialis]UDM78519.1 ABC transporter substrate-binding protein [Vagococcus fluvialis]